MKLFLYLFIPISIFCYQIDTFYGPINYNSEAIHKALEHPSLLRLKEINQYGTTFYIYHPIKYTRYDHSLGVWYITQRYGASINEQLAALFHDASHTVFSHVGDFFFNHQDGKNSYQDTIHLKYLKDVNLDTTLEIFGINLNDIDHKSTNFKCLEQPIPDICADRLEYNLQGGYLDGLLTKKDIETILKDLKFKNKTWYFKSPTIAKQFAEVPLYLTQNVWSHPRNNFTYTITAKILKHAIKLGILTEKDILLSTDDIVWNILKTKGDNKIQKNIVKMFEFSNKYQLTDEEDTKYKYFPKFRGIDPWIKTSSGLKRLTEVDEEFASRFNNAKKIFSKGFFIKKIK